MFSLCVFWAPGRCDLLLLSNVSFVSRLTDYQAGQVSKLWIVDIIHKLA